MNKNDNSLNSFYKLNNGNRQFIQHYLSQPHSGQFFNEGEQELTSFDSNGNYYVIDNVNKYYTNSDGYRDSDFKYKNSEILCVGCSHTFGTGLPEEATWPKLLHDKMNVTTSNLGIPGTSVQKLCKNIIKYCEMYGNPKYIFCLFPDFFRILFFEDTGYHVAEQDHRRNLNNSVSLFSHNSKVIGYDSDLDDVIYIKKPQKYIKRPFRISGSISPHQSLLQSIDSIFFLEKYCEAKNIKLYWTTWDINTKSILNQLLKLNNFELKKYMEWDEVPTNVENPNELTKYCTKNHESKFINNLCWDLAADRYKENAAWTHPGIHYQHHVVDFFKQFIEENNANIRI